MTEVWPGSTVTHVHNQEDPKGASNGSIKSNIIKSWMEDFVQIFGLNIDDHLSPASHFTSFLKPFPGF
ncbi:MAG: hypothetical protein ACK5VH_07010 [bacterium]|jgi:hypothetical protein